jgi:hypothetical protein
MAIYGGCRPKLRPVKSFIIAAAFGRLKRLQIGRPTAGYKACNMLANYGRRIMVKINKIGESPNTA